LLLAPPQVFAQRLGQALLARCAFARLLCAGLWRFSHTARCNGQLLIVSSSKLFLDPDLGVPFEDHRHRLLGGVCGGLIRVLAPPRLNTRPIAFH
jgi:hypothetical protein